MKNRASLAMKHAFCVLSSIVKSKSMALRIKTNDIRNKMIIYYLVRNRRFFLPNFSHKLSAFVSHSRGSKRQDQESEDRAISVCKSITLDPVYEEESKSDLQKSFGKEDCTHTDPLHSTINSEGCKLGLNSVWNELSVKENGDSIHSVFLAEGSNENDNEILETVKNTNENSWDFNLEENIDQAADWFIERFHRQLRLERMQS